MEKPAALRTAITAADPHLARDPDRLNMWVEHGRIRAPMTPARGFTWEYTLSITITDLTLHPSVLFLAINDWLRVNQPDLLTALPNSGYEFEADILGPQTIDLVVTLKLSEQVALVTNTDGTQALQHLAEPDMTWLTGETGLTTPAVPLIKVIAIPGAG